jgi:hypothetical protein
VKTIRGGLREKKKQEKREEESGKTREKWSKGSRVIRDSIQETLKQGQAPKTSLSCREGRYIRNITIM